MIPWTAARQASQTLGDGKSSPGVCPSSCPLNWWPKYSSFSFSISSSNEYAELISFRIDWFDLAVQETLKSLLQHPNSKASILWPQFLGSMNMQEECTAGWRRVAEHGDKWEAEACYLIDHTTGFKHSLQFCGAFKLWFWRRLLRVPWTARSNQSILKEINPEYSWEGLMLKLKLQYFGHLIWRADSLEKPWCWERLKVGGEGDGRAWDSWMASLTQWTWVG